MQVDLFASEYPLMDVHVHVHLKVLIIVNEGKKYSTCIYMYFKLPQFTNSVNSIYLGFCHPQLPSCDSVYLFLVSWICPQHWEPCLEFWTETILQL